MIPAINFLRGSGVSFAALLAVSAGVPMLDADLVVEDLGNPGFVRSIVDHNDGTHILDQANTTAQAAMPVLHAGFGNTLCLTLTAAQSYASNKIPKWTFLYNGTGASTFFALSRTSVTGFHVFAANTPATAGSARGWVFAAFNSGGQYTVGNGSQAVLNTTPGANFTINTPTYKEMSYQEGASPEWAYRAKGTITTSGSTTNTPSAADTTVPMVLNNGTSGGFGGEQIWRCWYNNPFITPAQRTLYQTYFQQKLGLPP